MKRKPHATIAAGLANPENDVELPSRRNSGSMISQIAVLEVGETFSRAKRIDDSMTVAEVREALATMRLELRNTVSKAAARAKEESKREYRVEVFDTLTIERNWFLIALITRTE